MLEATFFGNATVSITTGETTVLVDPYLTENEECPWDANTVVERENPDAICITHAAFDHVGDAVTIVSNYQLPVITEPATAHYLRLEGISDELITTGVWGMTATVGDLSIRLLEAHHASSRVHDGALLSGIPLSFLFNDGDSSIYHMGDTSISRDLETFGSLYQPDAVFIGVGQAFDCDHESNGPVSLNISELTTSEAAKATRWLNCRFAVPMHYVSGEREAFLDLMAETEDTPEVVPLDPGESLKIPNP